MAASIVHLLEADKFEVGVEFDAEAAVHALRGDMTLQGGRRKLHQLPGSGARLNRSGIAPIIIQQLAGREMKIQVEAWHRSGETRQKNEDSSQTDNRKSEAAALVDGAVAMPGKWMEILIDDWPVFGPIPFIGLASLLTQLERSPG